MVGTAFRTKYIGDNLVYRWEFFLIFLVDLTDDFHRLGSYAGAVLGIPLSGILTEYLNWQVAFYFYGKIVLLFVMQNDDELNE